jgi:phosphate-selective porin OprO/OprP
MTRHSLKSFAATACAASALALLATNAGAQTAPAPAADEIRALREQIALLQRRLDTVEAKASQAPATAPATAPVPAKPAPDSVTVKVNNKGFSATTEDKSFSFLIKTRLQTDFLFFPDSTDGVNQFYIRRALISFRGNAGPTSWVFTPSFAGSPVLEDGWFDYAVSDAIKFEVGKYVGFEGLENTQSSGKLLFAERGLQNNLVASRDIGVKLFGSLGEKVFGYGVSVSNGTLDGLAMNNNAELSSDKLYSAIVTVSPFVNDKESPFANMMLGLAGSFGQENSSIDGSTDRTLKFKSGGRNSLVTIQNGVVLKGDRYRWNPQFYWYYKSFGLLSEYVSSTYNMSRDGVSREITNTGWTVQASYVLTGEKASFSGVKPAHPFSFKEGGWGAFEVGLRLNAFEGDRDLFAGSSSQMLASSSSTQKAVGKGLSLKWYLTENLLWEANFEYTDFSGLGARRDDEAAILSRFQIDF